MRAATLILPALLAPLALAATCTLCEDGSSTTVPDKIVYLPPLDPIACSAIEVSIPFLIQDVNSEECQLTRKISSICGCTIRDDACSLCPDGTPVSQEYSATKLPTFTPVFGDAPFSCSLMEAYLHSFPESDGFCPHVQLTSAEICGCPNLPTSVDGEDNHSTGGIYDGNYTQPEGPSFDVDTVRFSFFGADSQDDLVRLNRVSLAAAILSIIGATFILQDNFRSRKTKLQNMYNQIVTIMAAFDIIFAIATALGDIPRPTNDYVTSTTEKGNDASCIAQGWFIQWGGLSSLFLNASLSTYYLVVVVYRFKSSRLKKLQKWMLGGPIVVGTILACASIPFTTTSQTGCHIPPPYKRLIELAEAHAWNATWGPYLALVIIPGYSVLAYTTIALGLVYWHIRKINQKAQKWQFHAPANVNANIVISAGSSALSASTNQKAKRTKRKKRRTAAQGMQAEVAWQSAWYLFALYLSWFFYLTLGVNMESLITGNYPVWVIMSFITPLQGFTNSLVYVRPRISRFLSKLRKERKVRQKILAAEAAATGAANGSSGWLEKSVTSDSSDDVYENPDICAEPAADIVAMNNIVEESGDEESLGEGGKSPPLETTDSKIAHQNIDFKDVEHIGSKEAEISEQRFA